MTDHVKKGSPIPCDTTSYDGSPGAIVAIEKYQRRIKAHTASCDEYEQWLLKYYGPLKRDSDITCKQDIHTENLIRERDEALEGLIVHLSYPHISSGGASGKGDGSVDLPEDPLVAAEVLARLRHLCSTQVPLTVLLWDAA
jgi:hypothetical protein